MKMTTEEELAAAAAAVAAAPEAAPQSLPQSRQRRRGQQQGCRGVLGTSLKDTYVMYPYHESHVNRALGSPECYQIRYLITQRIRI